jgi:hypothetical protein
LPAPGSFTDDDPYQGRERTLQLFEYGEWRGFRAPRSAGAKADIGGAVDAAITALSPESGKRAGHE